MAKEKSCLNCDKKARCTMLFRECRGEHWEADTIEEYLRKTREGGETQ